MLAVKDADGNLLLVIPVHDNQFFYISYTHSVAQSPVKDYFKIKNDKIVLDKTIYRDFGAGLPHMPGEGQKMFVENGKIILENYNHEFARFDLRVGRLANHQLVLLQPGAREEIGCPLLSLPLNYLSAPGSAITFSIVESAIAQSD